SKVVVSADRCAYRLGYVQRPAINDFLVAETCVDQGALAKMLCGRKFGRDRLGKIAPAFGHRCEKMIMRCARPILMDHQRIGFPNYEQPIGAAHGARACRPHALAIPGEGGWGNAHAALLAAKRALRAATFASSS